MEKGLALMTTKMMIEGKGFVVFVRVEQVSSGSFERRSFCDIVGRTPRWGREMSEKL